MRLTAMAGALALTAGAFAGSAAVAQDDMEELDGTGVVIDLIVKENINPFWVWMIDGATARAEELGANLNACWGVQDPDPEGQTECIENAISRGATTILIAPANAGVTPAVELARENGLMVIALDTATDPPDAVDVTFATDNFEAGLKIGEWAARSGRTTWYHAPSLAQHVADENSALAIHPPDAYLRTASDFPGVDFDATDLIQ